MQVTHDTTAYTIPITIEYHCSECKDTGTVTQIIAIDDWNDVPCPWCNLPDEYDRRVQK